jgi:hypothetical protein
MSYAGDLESLVYTVCFLLYGELPWRPLGHREPDRGFISFKAGFHHLVAEGQVSMLAGTRFQELVRSYYHAVTTPEKRPGERDISHFRRVHYCLQQAGWLISPAAS